MEVPGHNVAITRYTIQSEFLERPVIIDIYIPPASLTESETSLLLINDGQDLEKMHFESILEKCFVTGMISSLLCVGIHCGRDRKNEYGTAGVLDYKGRGARAELYSKFIFQELLPFIRQTLKITSFREKAFTGFSLGGLSALDISWSNPSEFTKVGVCSGSFWWRDKDQEDPDFNEDTDRIMHRLIREGDYYPWMKFFFEVGTMDETADRNNNGIIDSIDDTLSLIDELIRKGYPSDNIKYLELSDGRHDVETWGRVMPVFLEWGWGR